MGAFTPAERRVQTIDSFPAFPVEMVKAVELEFTSCENVVAGVAGDAEDVMVAVRDGETGEGPEGDFTVASGAILAVSPVEMGIDADRDGDNVGGLVGEVRCDGAAIDTVEELVGIERENPGGTVCLSETREMVDPFGLVMVCVVVRDDGDFRVAGENGAGVVSTRIRDVNTVDAFAEEMLDGVVDDLGLVVDGRDGGDHCQTSPSASRWNWVMVSSATTSRGLPCQAIHFSRIAGGTVMMSQPARSAWMML